MNDPHVKTIHYRINHAPGVSYANATPLTVDTEPDFSVQIEKLNAEIEMKTHYPTEEAARQVIEPFLRKWELSAGLLNPSDGFRFEFLSAEIIHRAPSPGRLRRSECTV